MDGGSVYTVHDTTGGGIGVRQRGGVRPLCCRTGGAHLNRLYVLPSAVLPPVHPPSSSPRRSTRSCHTILPTSPRTALHHVRRCLPSLCSFRVCQSCAVALPVTRSTLRWAMTDNDSGVLLSIDDPLLSSDLDSMSAGDRIPLLRSSPTKSPPLLPSSSPITAITTTTSTTQRPATFQSRFLSPEFLCYYAVSAAHSTLIAASSARRTPPIAEAR